MSYSSIVHEDLSLYNTAPIYTLREYTSNDTWVKPGNLKYLYVVCLAGGGGGGSGRVGATSTNRIGGTGGAGGTIVMKEFAVSELSASHAITVGAGGAGGAGQTSDDTDGNIGIAGGDTSFGSSVIAKGGGAGQPGTTAGVTILGGLAAVGSANTPSIKPYTIVGSDGGYSVYNNNSAPGSAYSMTSSGAAGGGGGGSCRTTNVTYSAGVGSRVWNRAGSQSTAATAGNAGTANIAIQFFDLWIGSLVTPTHGVGSSGAGSEYSATGSAVGGAGALYGSGGGGSGGTINGYDTAAGGAGAAGLCLVVEVY